MNKQVVDRYAIDLRRTLGASDFQQTFEKLSNDSEVKQPEAVAILGYLLESSVAPSTPKAAALARILKLHTSLATFKLKQRAVGGKSAA